MDVIIEDGMNSFAAAETVPDDLLAFDGVVVVVVADAGDDVAVRRGVEVADELLLVEADEDDGVKDEMKKGAAEAERLPVVLPLLTEEDCVEAVSVC